MRALIALITVAAVAVGAILLTAGTYDRQTTPHGSSSATDALRAVPVPRLTAEQIDRQDPPEAQRQRDEARAHDRRPLLNALPIMLHGVRFDIGGLASDGRSTIVRAHAPGLGHRRAQIAYATLRRRTGDRSTGYRLVIEP